MFASATMLLTLCANLSCHNIRPSLSLPHPHVQAIVLLVMYIEAIVVIKNQKNHLRVLRCLRIIFFIDTYIMSGVRR